MKNQKTAVTVILLLLVVVGIAAATAILLGNIEDTFLEEGTTKKEASTKKEETTAADEETAKAGSDASDTDEVVITFDIYKVTFGDTVTYDRYESQTATYSVGENIELPDYSDNGWYLMLDTVLPGVATESKTISVYYYQADFTTNAYFTPDRKSVV